MPTLCAWDGAIARVVVRQGAETVTIDPEAGQPALITRRHLLALGAAASLAGCARARGGDRISWWAIGQEGEYASLLLPPFGRETGIAVDTQALPWTAAHEKLLTGYAGDSLPDVIMVKNDWLPELALIGALAVPPAGGLLENHFPSALAAATVNGRAVAVPWVVDGWAHYYRPDLLASAGYTAPPDRWDDWLRMARDLKRRWPDRHVTLHLLDWPEPLFAFAAQQPDPLLRDRDARGNFSSAGFRAMLARYKAVFDEGLSPAVGGAEFGDTLVALRRGQILTLPSNAETVGDLGRRASWFPPALWRVAPPPGPTGPATGVANGYSLAVTRAARDPARAWRLVEYLCRPATQLLLHRIVGALPSRPAAWTAPEMARDPAAAVFGAAVRASSAPPGVPEWERIVTEVQLVAEQMVRGRFGVDAAAAEMDRRVDSILAKRRWLLDRGRIA